MKARMLLVTAGLTVLALGCDVSNLHRLIEAAQAASTLYVDATAAEGGDGKSWETAFRYLDEAVEVAESYNTDWGMKVEIRVAEGVYRSTEPADDPDVWSFLRMFDGLKLYGGYPQGGGERDPELHLTVLSGDIGEDDVVNADGITESVSDIVGTNITVLSLAYHNEENAVFGSDTVVDGFTITGGGLYLRVEGEGKVSSPVFTDLRFAAVGMSLTSADGAECSPYMENISFEQCGVGLGVVASGGLCDPTIRNVSFLSNESWGYRENINSGGEARTAMIGAHFLENSGGGIWIDVSDAGSRCESVFVNLRFEGNRSSAVSITNNNVEAAAVPVFMNALFVGNSASYGGAIYCGSSGVCAPKFHHLTITADAATNAGGACYFAGACAPEIFNSVIWGNSAPSYPTICNNMASPVFYYSIIEGCGGSGAGWNSTYGTDGSNNLDTAPAFVGVPNAGDGDWTTVDDNDYGNLRLSGGSSGINAGQILFSGIDTEDLDEDGLTNEWLPYDIAWNPRIIGLSCDMGAYESY